MLLQREHCIVLFPTNGVGFGHFTRMYAVARALRKADPDLEIVFTPMPTLHVLYNEKFPTYHLAGRYMHKDMTATQWNGLVEDMLHLVLTHTGRSGSCLTGRFLPRDVERYLLTADDEKVLDEARFNEIKYIRSN